ncbi:hypothetical protein GF391_00915 [Candidatus Uhrbacteria bacterium]|nr:hypothetical protein [Candidatus Uhrbacteria bacterium]
MRLDKNGEAMKVKKFFLILVLAYFIAPSVTYAYQPKLIRYSSSYTIQNPERGVAYYSELMGNKMRFLINFEKADDLVIKIRMPDMPESHANKIQASLNYKNRDGEYVKETLALDEDEWSEYHDELTGNDYLLGPEFQAEVASGTHTLFITSPPDNEKPFVLIVGYMEDKSLGAQFEKIIELGKIKNMVYSEFPLKAYYNIYGVVLLIPTVVIVALIVFIAVKEYLRIKKQDQEEEVVQNDDLDGEDK